MTLLNRECSKCGRMVYTFDEAAEYRCSDCRPWIVRKLTAIDRPVVWLAAVWVWLRKRPIMKCPCCDGSGGNRWMGEWSECWCCYEHSDSVADHWENVAGGWGAWICGRIPFWLWVRYRASTTEPWMKCPPSVIDGLRCRLGWHRFEPDGVFGGRLECRTCLRSPREVREGKIAGDLWEDDGED